MAARRDEDEKDLFCRLWWQAFSSLSMTDRSNLARRRAPSCSLRCLRNKRTSAWHASSTSVLLNWLVSSGMSCATAAYPHTFIKLLRSTNPLLFFKKMVVMEIELTHSGRKWIMGVFLVVKKIIFPN